MIPMPVSACGLIQSASRMLMLALRRRRQQQQQQQPVSGCRSSKQQPEKELGLSKRRKKTWRRVRARARAFACYIIRSISGKIECITPPEPEVQATGAEPRRGGRMCGGEDQNGWVEHLAFYRILQNLVAHSGCARNTQTHTRGKRLGRSLCFVV